jgi:hypothetical protein
MKTLSLGDREHWEHGLPVAYDIATTTAETLLLRDFVVLFDSTFTFIPFDGREGVWHGEQLDRLRHLSRAVGATISMVRLRAGLPELLRRRAGTGRLSDTIVEGIWDLHQRRLDNEFPGLVLSTDDLQPSEVALRIVGSARGIAPDPLAAEPVSTHVELRKKSTSRA